MGVRILTLSNAALLLAGACIGFIIYTVILDHGFKMFPRDAGNVADVRGATPVACDVQGSGDDIFFAGCGGFF